MDAYEKAIKLLKLRPHHSAELTNKLLMRGFDRDQIKEVIQKLQEENLIDNDQFAQIYLDELMRNKIFGFYGLKNKLLQRGVTSNEADKLLRKNLPLDREREIAMKFVNRSSGLSKQKIVQRLSSRGFRSDVIRSIVQDFC